MSLVPCCDYLIVYLCRCWIVKNAEKVKTRLAIFTKASTYARQIEGQKVGAKILEELKEIKDLQKKLVTFMEY